MAGKGDGDGWALFVDMRDAPWSVSGWQVGGGGVDQGPRSGRARQGAGCAVAKGGQGQQRGETVGSSPA